MDNKKEMILLLVTLYIVIILIAMWWNERKGKQEHEHYCKLQEAKNKDLRCKCKDENQVVRTRRKIS